MYIDTYQYQEIKKMGILNSHLFSYGFEKHFYYNQYGGIKQLNKYCRRFGDILVCEVVDLHCDGGVKYYNRNGKVLKNTFVKMNYYYYDDNRKLIELKHLKNKSAFITIGQLNSENFYPFHLLDYNIMKRTFKLQKIKDKLDGNKL